MESATLFLQWGLPPSDHVAAAPGCLCVHVWVALRFVYPVRCTEVNKTPHGFWQFKSSHEVWHPHMPMCSFYINNSIQLQPASPAVAEPVGCYYSGADQPGGPVTLILSLIVLYVLFSFKPHLRLYMHGIIEQVRAVCWHWMTHLHDKVS